MDDKIIESFKLTDNERNSALWDKLFKHLQDRLSALRIRNDGQLDTVETAEVRGAIKEVKRLMRLNEPPIE